jgi:hypothetical protein
MVQVAVSALMPSDLICALRLMIVDEPSAAPNTWAGRSAALAACAVRVSGDPGSSYKYALRLAQPMSGSAADRAMTADDSVIRRCLGRAHDAVLSAQ